MRCKNCPYEHDGDCNIFGDNEDFVYENSKGEMGCRFNLATLNKERKVQELEEKEICRQMGDFAKWHEETYGKEAK